MQPKSGDLIRKTKTHVETSHLKKLPIWAALPWVPAQGRAAPTRTLNNEVVKFLVHPFLFILLQRAIEAGEVRK